MKTLRDLFKDYRFTFSFIVLVIIVILAVLSFFSPYDPTLWGVVPKNMKPSADLRTGHRFERAGCLLAGHLRSAQFLDYLPHLRIGFKGDRHPGWHGCRI